jgi:outer membrane protein, heavy metal efflux system
MRLRLLAIFIFCCFILNAQEHYTLEQCEAKFLSNNYLLIANQFNIEASKALTLQAKLWENPIVSADLNAINPTSNRYFDIGKNGQKGFAIEQLIYLGGKKKHEIEWSKSNEKLAELYFLDVIRNLKFELRNNFFSAYFNTLKLESIQSQIVQIDSLVASYARQVEKGNLPLRDLVRLKALSLSIKNEKIAYQSANNECFSKLKLILSDSTDFKPELNSQIIQKYSKVIVLDRIDLINTAKSNRPDFSQSTINRIQSEQYIKWQKSLATPNINIGAAYDQRGGAFVNQANLTLSMPLPIINRNQGNIKYAEAISKQAEISEKESALRIEIEVNKAIDNFYSRMNIYSQFEFNSEEYRSVYLGMVQNFKKGNVNLLEFVDFIESYNTMSIQYNELQLNVLHAAVELENVVNISVFK